MVHADVNEAAEVNNVSYSTLKLHIRLEVVDVEDVGGEDGCGSVVTDVTAGLFKLGDDVLEGGLATAELASELCHTVLSSLEAEKNEVAGANVVGGEVKALQKILGDSVGLGVNAGGVEHLLAVVDAKESGALSKRLLTELRNLEDLGAGLELAVLFSVLNDILCNGGIDTRNVGKERVGCGIDVNADTVYTALNDAAECLGKARLLHIVLILTYADRLRLDLNELGEGILNTSRDRDSGSLHYVKVGELLGSNLGCRVNGCACLGDDGVLYGLGAGGIAENVLSDKLLGLTGCGTVTDSDNVDAALVDKAKNLCLRAVDVLSGLDGVDNVGIKNLTGLVNYGELTAVGVAGVVAEDGLALEGSGKKKVTKILGEHLECSLGCIVEEGGTNLPLDSGEEQTLVCVLDSSHKVRKSGRLHIGDDLGDELCHAVVLVEGYGNLEELLLLAAVDSENAVAFKLLDRLGEVVVVLVNRAFLGSALGGKRAVLHGELTEHLSDLGVVGDVLGDDVGCALECGGNVGNCLILLVADNDELLGIYLDRGIVGVALLENVVSERLKPLVACNRCTCLSLRSEGKIYILKLYERFSVVKSKGDLGSKLFLCFDERGDLGAALIHLAKIVEAVVKIAESSVVKSACHLFTVTGDERNGVALVDECDGFLYLLLFDFEFLG